MMSRPWAEVLKSVFFSSSVGLPIWLLICWRAEVYLVWGLIFGLIPHRRPVVVT
ncbi:hypothetical protein RHMOL_Rhmol01G0300900 [Rhododendron molle]|uniref:Uncharacterized protein n=1 Tax=Rhododendron molle TaxID=49168 RepID=A0ACC0Q8H1_RHOML|nr:hypothetical protein RHMOL_Rhmol01G0300900 [Rhododendron molle]